LAPVAARTTGGRSDAAEFLTCGGTTAAHGRLNADPLSLLDDLKEVSSVQSSGAGDNATYAFRGAGLSGTVTLLDGRVSSVTVQVDGPRKREVHMTLSDYGVPVSRTAPW
jgi:hypothetical protein